MTIGKVTIPLFIKRSDLVAQLVNLTSVCIKKKMSVQKKKLFNRGQKTGIKSMQKEGRRNVKGGTSHSLTCPPPLFPLSKNKILMRWTQLDIVVWHQLSTCCYMGQFWENAEFTRKYKRDWEYDKISCRIKLAQNSLYYSTTPPIRPSKENEKWCE